MNKQSDYTAQFNRVRASLPRTSFSCGFGIEFDASSAYQVANFYVNADDYGRFYATNLIKAVNKLMREAGITRVQQYIDLKVAA